MGLKEEDAGEQNDGLEPGFWSCTFTLGRNEATVARLWGKDMVITVFRSRVKPEAQEEYARNCGVACVRAVQCRCSGP